MGAEVRFESINAENRQKIVDLQKELDIEKKSKREIEKKCFDLEQKEKQHHRELKRYKEKIEKYEQQIKTLEVILRIYFIYESFISLIKYLIYL